MKPFASLPRAVRVSLVVVGVLLALAILIPVALTPLVAAGVHAFARARGLEARWSQLAFGWPATVRLRDLTLRRSADGAGVLSVGRVEAALAPEHHAGGAQFAAVGVLGGEHRVPFDVSFQWRSDDGVVGRASFRIPDERHFDAPVAILFDGRVTQDRHAGVLRVEPGTHVSVGQTEMSIAGDVERAGPRFRLALEMDHLSADAVQQSLPRAVLGPLRDLPVTGSWDWRASLDLDVARPDSTRFTADVILHGPPLTGGASRLHLAQLARPFVAEIHVPPDRIVFRDLSDSNENFRPLARISPLLRAAVITNEDGGFYQHRGFNPGAIQSAMAENM